MTACACVHQHDAMLIPQITGFQVDEDQTGEVDFNDFLKIYQKFRADNARASSDRDTMEAFTALGGNVSCELPTCMHVTEFASLGFMEQSSLFKTVNRLFLRAHPLKMYCCRPALLK